MAACRAFLDGPKYIPGALHHNKRMTNEVGLGLMPKCPLDTFRLLRGSLFWGKRRKRMEKPAQLCYNGQNWKSEPWGDREAPDFGRE